MNVALTEMHKAHKERQARIAARKYRPASVDAEVVEPTIIVAEPEPAPQREPWFRILKLEMPTVRDIQDVVAEFYSISYVDLVSSRREQPVVFYRQVAMMIAKDITKKSLPEIGRRFGGRDHTTVLHGVRKARATAESDRELQDEIAEIKSRLEAL